MTVSKRRSNTRHNIDPVRRAEIGQEKRARTRARILAVTFDLFGHENGLFTRVEEICLTAAITRQTFYNHFASLEDLREALTYEVTHAFLEAVVEAVLAMPDAAERSSAAIRFYLDKAASDAKWGWSMVNISACGIVFGMETYLRAQQTVQEGIDAGTFAIADSRIGRDLIMGSALAAIVTQLKEGAGPGYTLGVVTQILVGLGVAADAATAIVARPLPNL